MKNDISIECTVTATTDLMADSIYQRATQRLLNVNQWKSLDGSLLDACQLVDERGISVDRDVHTKDFLRMPDGDAATPFRWIRVENIEEVHDESGAQFMLMASPAIDPWHTATSDRQTRPGMISIVRKGLNVTARVYARAQSGIESVDMVERMRNISSSMHFTMGAYCVQWRSLMNALVGNVDNFQGQAV